MYSLDSNASVKRLVFTNDVSARYNDQDTISRNSLSPILDSISPICNSSSAHKTSFPNGVKNYVIPGSSENWQGITRRNAADVCTEIDELKEAVTDNVQTMSRITSYKKTWRKWLINKIHSILQLECLVHGLSRKKPSIWWRYHLSKKNILQAAEISVDKDQVYEFSSSYENPLRDHHQRPLVYLLFVNMDMSLDHRVVLRIVNDLSISRISQRCESSSWMRDSTSIM
ncbi:Uncharacterized protein Y057_4761 [Fusarium fujikuroi]|nr:Uncharacterized protein Y057_4761 [Fusarium fujikuroi]